MTKRYRSGTSGEVVEILVERAIDAHTGRPFVVYRREDAECAVAMTVDAFFGTVTIPGHAPIQRFTEITPESIQ